MGGLVLANTRRYYVRIRGVSMKKRGGYTMDLRRQVRLRIPEEMYHSLMQISDKMQVTLSKVMREFLRAALRTYHS